MITMECGIVKITDAFDYNIMLQDLAGLKKRYQDLEIINIGKSVLGRYIPAIRLGTGKKQIQYNASFHANEWITSILLLVFMEKCLEAIQQTETLYDTNISQLLREKSLWIVPMVNPDGVDLVQKGIVTDNNPWYRQVLQANKGSTNFRCWKANIRGVDLNYQFPAYWEREYSPGDSTTGPAPFNYPGPFPLSEPEARAISDFTRENNFELVKVFHTQGEKNPLPVKQFEYIWQKTVTSMLAGLVEA